MNLTSPYIYKPYYICNVWMCVCIIRERLKTPTLWLRLSCICNYSMASKTIRTANVWAVQTSFERAPLYDPLGHAPILLAGILKKKVGKSVAKVGQTALSRQKLLHIFSGHHHWQRSRTGVAQGWQVKDQKTTYLAWFTRCHGEAQDQGQQPANLHHKCVFFRLLDFA